MINAYFDESGHESHRDCPVLVVGGFAGPPFAWEEFEDVWRKKLAARGVKDFHANDVDARFGEFSEFSSADRDALFGDLVASLEGKNIFPFAVITDVASRREISGLGVELVVSAFEQCAKLAMELVLTTFRDLRAQGETVNFAFEQNHEFAGAAARAFRQVVNEYGADIVTGFCMPASIDVVPLHAADFLTHEITVKEKRIRAGKPPRYWMTELERIFPPPRGIPVVGINKTLVKFPARMIQSD